MIKTAGTLQLCAGQEAGNEAAIHAMCNIFEDAESEAVLLVNASNAFNSLNHKAALYYITASVHHPNQHLRGERSAFADGETQYSCDGTTQGDPLVMVMYTIGILPLIHQLQTMELFAVTGVNIRCI